MAVSVPSNFPLYRASMAEVIEEYGPIEADPDGLDLLRAGTWAYATAARPLLCAVEGGDQTTEGLRCAVAASPTAREVIARGWGYLSAHSSSVTWRAELYQGDLLVEVLDSGGTVRGSGTVTQLARAVVTGQITGLGAYAGQLVQVVVSLRQAGATIAELYHFTAQEDAVAAASLPE
jgi:hypothetical protein